ncbi:MAG: ABC transporter substrate-binding protein [candidate division WOR-3 bacterium]
MADDLRTTIIERLKPLFVQYDSNFQDFLSTGQRIDTGLQTNSEILSEIRHRFNNLSATVELVLEGVSVFDTEIKETHEFLKKSIENFKESVLISEKISSDLNNIAEVLKKIQLGVRNLAEIIYNINFVSESIEVASRNAGITAFHAGREGRGFEVIAREMTGLVRNVQRPTKIIPVISNELLKNIDELNQDLKNIKDVIAYLREIADKFLNINNELLALIPYLESSIRDISNSVTIQKDLHINLQKESDKLPEYLGDIYRIIRTTAITEMFLGAFFQHLSNIKNSLMIAEDKQNFYYIFNTIKQVLEYEPRLEGEHEHFFNVALRKLEMHTSERLILQFVSEAKHLNEVIGVISDRIKSWTKTHNFANETLTRAKVFYQDIAELLRSLNEKSTKLKELINKVERPVQELKKITERSRLLGLYAGIESARSGKFAEELGVVTNEIKTLSMRSSEFVGNIDAVVGEILKDINHLISYFVRTTEDVKLGLESLTISMEAVGESSKVLDDISALSQEMFSSTAEMVNQCRMLGEHYRNFDTEYHKISEYFSSYGTTIKSGEELTKKMKAIINEFKKDISLLTAERKKIILRATEDPITLDPAIKTDTTSHQVIEQIFTGLYTFDQFNHLIPGVAFTFTVSEDGKIWDFRLKKGVKFHNGIEVQAKDILFSLNRVKKGPNANFIEYLTEMVVIDPYHIRFILKFPYVPFLSNLACGVCDIVPSDFNPEKPIGCGPYKLVSYEKNNEIVLEAFDEFYDGRPPIDECVIKIVHDDTEAVELFKKHEISILNLTTNILQEFSQEQIYTGPVLSTQYLAINFSKKSPFLDLNVRRAMNYAIDRDYYCRTLLKGKAIPAHGVYPPGLPGYNNNLQTYQYDIKKARDLMRQAGFGSGIPEEFVLDVRAGVDNVKRAEFIKDSFAKIGIHLQINPLPWDEFLNKTYSGNSLLSLRGWVSDNGDPDNFVYTLFHSKNFGASGNTSFYANEELDKLIESARAEQIPRRRIELYQKIENFVVENALWVFVSHGVDCYAVQKNIKGFTVDPFGLIRFRNLFCL